MDLRWGWKVSFVVLTSALAGLGVASAHAGDGSRGPDHQAVTACGVWAELLPAELTRHSAREAIICLVNQKRAAAGLPALEKDKRLRRPAQRHANKMDGTGCFSHRCPGERVLRKRLKRYLAGRPRRYKYGEVIAWAHAPLASPRQIVEALMASPRHRAHLLKPEYRDIGVGFAVGTPWAGLSLGGIYTIDMGMRTRR